MKMEWKKITSILLLVILLTACGPKTSAPTAPANSDGGAVEVVPTAQPNNPCANEYFPVKNNATFNYTSTGSQLGTYSFKRTISTPRADSFIVTTKFKGINNIQEWTCGPGGLFATQLGIDNAAGIIAFKNFTNLQASNPSGVIFPTSISNGSKWDYSLDFQGVESGGGDTPANVNGHVTITYLAKNKETVTVPAGKFEAMVITINTVINIQLVTPAKTTNRTVDNTYTAWYAPGVGLVKANGNGNIGGLEYFEAIELDSYTIP